MPSPAGCHRPARSQSGYEEGNGGVSFADVESPAGRYQRVVMALAGVAAMVGAWWQPALGCALVGVPAWLLLGRGLGPD